MVPDRSTVFLIWIIWNVLCMTWKESEVISVLVQDRLLVKVCHFALWLGFLFGATLII